MPTEYQILVKALHTENTTEGCSSTPQTSIANDF